MVLGVEMCMHQLTSPQTNVSLALGLLSAVLVGIVCYSGTLLCLWYWQGRPDGIEALIVSNAKAMLRRLR